MGSKYFHATIILLVIIAIAMQRQTLKAVCQGCDSSAFLRKWYNTLPRSAMRGY